MPTYAEITRAIIERDNPDMDAALTRTGGGAMCATRLMTYGYSASVRRILAQVVQTTNPNKQRTPNGTVTTREMCL